MKILKSVAKRVIAYDRLLQLRRAGERWRHFGLGRFCPCCKARVRRFAPFGLVNRPEAKCPVCGSLERHRLMWLYFTQKTSLFDGNQKKMLHVAPEPELSSVQDDRKAISEFHRVLKPGGWVILQVPITADTTFEDPTVISPKEKERLFGQRDHVRRYGPDYKDRLMEAGFSVTVDGFVRELDNRTVKRFGLMRNEDVYFCRKEAT